MLAVNFIPFFSSEPIKTNYNNYYFVFRIPNYKEIEAEEFEKSNTIYSILKWRRYLYLSGE